MIMEKEYFKAEKNFQDNQKTNSELDFPEDKQIINSITPTKQNNEEDLSAVRKNIESEIKKSEQSQTLNPEKKTPDIKLHNKIKTFFERRLPSSWFHKKDNHAIINDPATSHNHYYDDEN